MAGFDKEQLEQFEGMFDRQRKAIIGEVDQKLEDQRAAIMVDTESLLEKKLAPIREDVTDIRQKVTRLDKRADEDVRAAYADIEILKENDKRFEKHLATLER